MAKFRAPNGLPINAVLETCPCMVGIDSIDPKTGEVEYDGNGSVMLWDDQHPVVRGDRGRVYLDDDGGEWSFDQLVLITENEKEMEDA
jgi:hypothetical protein